MGCSVSSSAHIIIQQPFYVMRNLYYYLFLLSGLMAGLTSYTFDGKTLKCNSYKVKDSFHVKELNRTFTKVSEDMIHKFPQRASTACVSGIKNMSGLFHWPGMFFYPTDLKLNLSSWDTSSVTDMSRMFYYFKDSVTGLNFWNTSQVKTMEAMFFKATYFNENISLWNTSSVENMDLMFLFASSFNQDISRWCVQNVYDKFIDFGFLSNLSGNFYPSWGANCPMSHTG
jgi:surface protein